MVVPAACAAAVTVRLVRLDGANVCNGQGRGVVGHVVIMSSDTRACGLEACPRGAGTKLDRGPTLLIL